MDGAGPWRVAAAGAAFYPSGVWVAGYKNAVKIAAAAGFHREPGQQALYTGASQRLSPLSIVRETNREYSAALQGRLWTACRGVPWRACLGAALSVVLMTAATAPLQTLLGLTNAVMLLLLAAVLASYYFGPGPGLLAALLSVACFDFFFVPPHYSFSVHDADYTVTFLVMLSVAVLVGQITARLRVAASLAGERERRMGALFELARDLSSALTLAATAETGMRYLANLFNVQPAILVLEEKDQLQAAPGSVLPAEVEPEIAQWVCDQQCAAGRGTAQFDAAPALYLPLKAPMRTRGVLVLVPRGVDWQLQGDQRGLLETVAALIAIALERIHFVSVAQDALIHMESERLRNSLLSALSHDLKTPLTVLVGLADAISLAGPSLAPAQADIVAALREQALSTSTMVMNLLEMARLQAGNVRLQREWQPLEEVIGVALRARASVLADHRVRVLLPPDLPLVALDTLLMEHALCNLLENAAKYTAPGSCIEIAAHRDSEWVEITVADDGPGLPNGDIENLFEKFARGHTAGSGTDTGMGLGLSIVRAVIEAHEGTVTAHNRAEGGACFRMRLPAGTPPSVPVEEA